MSNRTAGMAFRNEVVLALQEAGDTTARPCRTVGGFGPQYPGIACLVDGVPGWTLMTRAKKSLQLSESVTDAQRLAALLGDGRSAVVAPRHGYDLAHAYILTTLSDFVSALTNGSSK